MKNTILQSGLIALTLFVHAPLWASTPTNLLIGTGGGISSSGNTFPGATRPFGLVRLSPDTGKSDFGGPFQSLILGYATAGYSWNSNQVLGFSHTRLSGTGVREGGAFRLIPEHVLPHNRVFPLFLHHDFEEARPGYYSLSVPQSPFQIELTATVHCGVHRYSLKSSGGRIRARLFPQSSLKEGGATDGKVQILGSKLWIEAHQQGAFSERYGGYPLYAYGEFSQVPERVTENGSTDFLFAAGQERIELRLCLSAVSFADAQDQFVNEVQARPFEQIQNEAAQDWENVFHRARIQTPDRNLEVIYYTALYHSFLMPTNWTGSRGAYRGFDQKIHQAQGFTYRTDLALWDTFRTVHPLYTLIAPEIQCDSVQSLMSMAEQTGLFPRWPSGTGESQSMFGSPANFLITETYLKNHCAFDARKALDLMVKGARSVGLRSSREQACQSFGYCPSDLVDAAVSKTLEYAWADAATARLAKALGDRATEQEFDSRAQAYRKIWDPTERYFSPRDSQGRFRGVEPNLLPYLDARGKAAAFAEGSANQWRYSVPHLPQDLIRLMGGPSLFVQELEHFMENHSRTRTALIPQGGYWHGNEHDLHAAYLFNEAGRADLTQKWVRWILTDRYANAPDGLAGNDDAGALSAWFVFSAVGLYPQAGTDRYWIGAPIIKQALWQLGDGKQLRILAHGQSPSALYLEKVLLNGSRICKPELRHQDLQSATLEFFMTDRPEPQGGFDCSL